MKWPKLSTLALMLSVSLSGVAAARDFTHADLEKMVAELDKVIPENGKYKYPIKCSLVDKNDVNAYATITKEGNDLRATMVVFTGLVKATGGDVRRIRAVVAHELSHLSRGHALDIDPAARDLRNLWTRQQEYEADKYGAIALEKCGYSKQDMIDMLLFLDQNQGRDGDWLEKLTADHADPKQRAAELADDPSALNALVAFDKGLAYEDARSHGYAQKLFDSAAARWPALTEAYINAARCSLLFYYDNLPIAVRSKWWRPDFGALITNPHVSARGVSVSDEDRDRWKDAMAEIEKAIQKNPDSEDAKALQALGRILEPDAIKDVVQLGIDWFKAQSASTSDQVLKLRYANNAGVGYHQLGDLQAAYHTIIDAQRGSDIFNSALGENLGMVRVNGRSKDDDTLAANVIFTWLSNTPADSSPHWKTVKSVFDEICTSAGIKAKEITPKPAYLCSVVTLVTPNNIELGLLLSASSLKKILGAPDDTIAFAEKWPDLTEIRWHQGRFSVLTERDKVMRLTSYEVGSYLELKPKDATSQDIYKVQVGMSKDMLFAMINEKASVKKQLAKGGQVETWNYFPDLDFGVLIDGDKVKAITVSPVQYEDPGK